MFGKAAGMGGKCEGKQLAIYNGVYNYPIAAEHLFVANTAQPMSVLLDKILRRIGKVAK